MKNQNPNSRRDFLKKAAAASTLFIVPRHVLGGVGYVAPSDQINLAAVGIGGKGRSDLRNAARPKNVRVVGLCDVDTKGTVVKDVIGSQKDFPKANFYADFREMLDKEKDIDALTISTPDHTHAPSAIYAMERNKHVYVQKPLTHNVREARILTEMARKQKVVTQMGNQGASNPDQLQVQQWVDSGVVGAIGKVKVWTNRPVWPQGVPMPEPNASMQPDGLNWDLWLGPAKETAYTPEMHPFNWRGWWQYGTGALGDMGCHIIDVPFRALGLKYPKAVECSVGSVYRQMWTAEYLPEGCPPSSQVVLNFDRTDRNPSPIEMTWTDGGIRPSHPDLIPPNDDLGEPGGYNGVMMIGEKGIITTGVYGMYPKLYLPGQPVQEAPKVVTDEPEFGHQRKWIDAIVAGFDSPEHRALTSSFDYAGPLTETVLMGNIAIRSYLLRKKQLGGRMDYYARKKLLWDGDAMKITNLEAANQFVTREYRSGWEL
ncbi:MAG: Gfo/Idh/MocA family protein [Flavobacteriaceae bacterium]